MNTRDLKERIRLVSWTNPSPELRARVLAEPRVTNASVTWTDRIWFSRGWRQSAVAASVVLITMALWPARETPEPSTRVDAVIALVEEVALETGFAPDQAAALARHAVRESQARAATDEFDMAQALLQGGDR